MPRLELESSTRDTTRTVVVYIKTRQVVSLVYILDGLRKSFDDFLGCWAFRVRAQIRNKRFEWNTIGEKQTGMFQTEISVSIVVTDG